MKCHATGARRTGPRWLAAAYLALALGSATAAGASPVQGRTLRVDLWRDLLAGELGQRLAAGEAVTIPLAVPRELASSLRVELAAEGAGSTAELSAPGAEGAVLRAGAAGPWSVEWPAAELERALGRAPFGRLAVRLDPSAGGRFARTHAWVELPAISVEELEREIVARLERIFGVWLERGLDREGPRPTYLACHLYDVVTGERLQTFRGGLLPLWGAMLNALAHVERPDWSAALDRHLADFLELCLDERSGLPREWDCVLDQPRSDAPVEVAAWLRFLLDVHQRGPAAWRAPALAAAEKMGAAVLERGMLPDGTIAASFVSGTGEPVGAAVELRRLNLPAELARLAKFAGQPRFLDAARRAIAEFEFTLHWGGSEERIDPDFDDNFGTLGAALTTVLEAQPEDELTRRMLREAWSHFLPLWRDALKIGGTVAADQVRCWEMAARFLAVDPDFQPSPAAVLPLAASAHLTGELYENGAWGDLTHVRFAPSAGISVGDLSGTPASLTWGLALLLDPLAYPSGDRAEIEAQTGLARAWYALLLRSTDQTYGRKFGYLLTRNELAGANRCGAELRLCTGLVTALRCLASAKRWSGREPR